MIQRLLNTLESGEVLRYHAAPGVDKQTDAAHSWGVAVIAMYLVPGLSVELLKECLLHDTAELMTGDIPSSAKRSDDDLNELLKDRESLAREHHLLGKSDLTEREHAILKICDVLESLMWCYHHETAAFVISYHRGRVGSRLKDSYLSFREKYNCFLNVEEWDRADNIFLSFGGCFPKGFHENLDSELLSNL